MYKSGQVTGSTFPVILGDNSENEIRLSVMAPKLRVLTEIEKAEKYDEIAEVISKILSNNRENRVITKDNVLDMLDAEEITIFLSEFFEWVRDLKKK